MPYLSDEQITEIELQFEDLLDQLADKDKIIAAQAAQLRHEKSDSSMDV